MAAEITHARFPAAAPAAAASGGGGGASGETETAMILLLLLPDTWIPNQYSTTYCKGVPRPRVRSTHVGGAAAWQPRPQVAAISHGNSMHMYSTVNAGTSTSPIQLHVSYLLDEYTFRFTQIRY